jgi:hypothetical protein
MGARPTDQEVLDVFSTPFVWLPLQAVAITLGGNDTADDPGLPPARFATPLLLESEDGPIRVEAPGYACPSWFDVDEDGREDLVVGQFLGGKMKVYRNLGDGRFAAGEWLEADGETAEVPGVW